MFPTRSIQELFAVCSFLKDLPGAWWIGGGWAIDCWLGKQTREHEDIEICIWRTDLPIVYSYCPDWQYFTPIDNDWSLIPSGTLLDETQFMLQLLQTSATIVNVPNMPPTFEFLLNDRVDDAWLVKDEPQVRMPLHLVYGLTPLGVPAVMPELVLLHKAWTVERAKDDHDFNQICDQLQKEQRAWLTAHIVRTRPEHRWLPRLTAQ